MIIISLKTLSPTYTTRIQKVRKLVPKCKRLLDAGCSDGYLDFFLKKKAQEMYGVDINEYDISLARELNPSVKYEVASLYDLPYKNNYFDTIVCVDVLEHLKKDKKAIFEMSRVLKSRGKLIITVPSKNFPISFDPINYVLKFFGTHINIGVWGYGHLRQYNPKELKKILKKHNLKVTKVSYLSHFLIGIFENSYIANILQPLTKSDPKNKKAKPKDILKLKKRLSYNLPFLLKTIRDKIIHFDEKVFSSSSVSLGILIEAEKQPL